MKEKKVLFLITKATNGGAQRYVFDLIVHTPYPFRPALVFGEPGQLSESLEAGGIQTMHIPALTRDLSLVADVQACAALLSCMRKAKPDVVHLNSSKAAALGALAARAAHIERIVFTVHGWPFKEERFLVSRIFIYIVSWFTAFLSHAVIVVSKRDEEIAKRMWWVRKKVTFIPLAREELKFELPHIGFQKMFGTGTPPAIQPDTIRLVTIAELTHNKGIRYGIDAIKHLTERGIDCIYVIPSDGEDLSTLTQYAQSLGLSDRVFFPGYVENAASYLKGFDVFVLPSIKEGTPYVIVEAGAAGLPVVATEAIDEHLTEEIPHLTRVPIKNGLALADSIQHSARSLQQKDVPRQRSLEAMVRATTALY